MDWLLTGLLNSTTCLVGYFKRGIEERINSPDQIFPGVLIKKKPRPREVAILPRIDGARFKSLLNTLREGAKDLRRHRVLECIGNAWPARLVKDRALGSAVEGLHSTAPYIAAFLLYDFEIAVFHKLAKVLGDRAE